MGRLPRLFPRRERCRDSFHGMGDPGGATPLSCCYPLDLATYTWAQSARKASETSELSVVFGERFLDKFVVFLLKKI